MSAIPLHSSPIPPNCTTDVVALSGCRRLGHSPMPVQRRMWFLLEAKRPDGRPLFPQVVIEVPRRAGKTDGILALLVGRCLATPGYRVGFAAQSGVKSRARFLDLITLLGRTGGGGWTAYRSRGEEKITFANDSVVSFHPPDPEHFRGDAFDCVVLDETQEVDEEEAADLLGSLLPVFDTRPESQLIVAGTAGASRSGLLWEALQQGRAGRWGILEFALAEGADPEDESIWLTVHPGPAGVSAEHALEVLRQRHAQMDPEMFRREYLGVWPEHSASMIFPAALWSSLAVDKAPAQPSRYGLAYECAPDGSRAAVTATWRVGSLVWGGVLDEREGTDWVADRVAALALRDRLPVYCDSTPTNINVSAQIAKRHPRVTVTTLGAVEFASACSLLHTEVMQATFRHTAQKDLDDAVAVAAKRPLGDGGWAWGRRVSSGYIHSLVSVSVGLKGFDMLPAQRITRVLSATPV